MKKLSDARLKRFIRFDRYFEKLRVKGFDKSIRNQFRIPLDGFKTPQDSEKWQKENLWFNPEKKREWDKALEQVLRENCLDRQYLSNLEMFILMDFIGSYDFSQPAISKERGEDQYLRNKAIYWLSQKKDPQTGRKIKAKKVAEIFQPGHDEDGKPLPESEQEKMPQYKFFNTDPKVNKWNKRYGLNEKKDPGLAVRRIVSKHRKSLS